MTLLMWLYLPDMMQQIAEDDYRGCTLATLAYGV
jgi:hypothetical protein